MKPWMEDFIRLCLAKIPDLPYRRRLAGELADHLASLAADLEEEGLPAGQARAQALERMGDPYALAGQYAAEWRRRAGRPRYWAPRLLLGCALMGGLYLLTLCALGLLGFTYDARPGIPMVGDPAASALAGCSLFLFSFFPGALFLARSLRFCPHAGALTAAGLLAAWAGEKLAILSLSALIYGLPLWQLQPLLARICGGASPTAPWFTPAYLLLTLAACPLLALCSSRFVFRPV